MLGADVAGLRTTISAAALILALLFSAMALTTSVRFASAQTESVTIKADGSVSPSTAPIQRVGDLYVLAGDVGQITVQRSNMTLDGDGHKLQGIVWFIDSLGNNVTVGNSGGIFLTEVENVTVKNFVLNSCQIGVSLDRSSHVTVTGNVITGAKKPLPSEYRAGVAIWMGDNNAIVGNHFENNYEAISLGCDLEHCTIRENNITGNSIGIGFWNASNNIIYHNNFINNTLHVYDDGAHSSQTGPEWAPSLNTWDNGKEGNFWSDYNGTDENSDGTGDTPYRVDSNNKDRYPLMKPWDPAKPVDTAPPLISVSSPQNKVYNDSSVPLNFSTNEPASKISCTLDNQDNVTIPGNATLSGLPNGSHNLTVYATDQFGNAGISETVYFSVEVPFPTTWIIVAATAIVAIVATGGAALIYFVKARKTIKKGE